MPHTKPLAGIDIPTPSQLQSAHDEVMRPDPVLVKAAMLCIIKVLTAGFPKAREFHFAYTHVEDPDAMRQPYFAPNLVPDIEAALRRNEWVVVKDSRGIIVKAKPKRRGITVHEGSRFVDTSVADKRLELVGNKGAGVNLETDGGGA